MNKPIYRFIQCMLLIGLAAFLAEKWVSGRLFFYINPRFAGLTLLGIAGLAGMALTGLAPLFSHQPADGEARTQKTGANLLIVFLLPLFVALIGLAAPLIVTMFLFVVLIGLTRLPRSHPGPADHSGHAETSAAALLLVAFPLILGVFAPAKPLSAAAVSARGMSLSAPSSQGGGSPVSLDGQAAIPMEIAPDDRSVLDWIKIFNYEEDLSPYLGATANVIGFVYHDPRLEEGQFMVGRFTITCCAADAFAIGMVVAWPGAADLADNTWVNVKGPVEALTLPTEAGRKVPLIQAQSVEPVQAPDQPYLYP